VGKNPIGLETGCYANGATLAVVNSLIGAINRLLTHVSVQDTLACFADLALLDSRIECGSERNGRIKTRSDPRIYLRGIKEPCVLRREGFASFALATGILSVIGSGC
jgi:hypothetical protein